MYLEDIIGSNQFISEIKTISNFCLLALIMQEITHCLQFSFQKNMKIIFWKFCIFYIFSGKYFLVEVLIEKCGRIAEDLTDQLRDNLRSEKNNFPLSCPKLTLTCP